MEFEVYQLMLKDSLEMTDEDRAAIGKKCCSIAEQRIIIIHGTDTMLATARRHLAKCNNKTVVFFGAMIPYSMGNSDALFNFGCACAAVQALPAGVYITMNGKIFHADNVWKNRTIGDFQPIEEK